MSRLFTSTTARKNFFEILNQVLYSDEKIYISKAGSEQLVKLERVEPGRKTFEKLAGSISKKDADIMKKTISEARKRKSRKVKDF